MAYEVVMPYHLHMPSYFLETFTEYPFIVLSSMTGQLLLDSPPSLFSHCSSSETIAIHVITLLNLQNTSLRQNGRRSGRSSLASTIIKIPQTYRHQKDFHFNFNFTVLPCVSGKSLKSNATRASANSPHILPCELWRNSTS